MGRPLISREDLIALCERGRVPQDSWRNRDSAAAQRQLGEAWALLSAGCDFTIDADSDAQTWWVTITYEGFAFHEDGDPDSRETDTAYIPTAALLDRVNGEDWY